MKRTPMTRSKPLRATGPATAKSKLRKCAVKACRREFLPGTPWQVICSNSLTCACAWAEQEAAKRQAAAARKAKREAAEDRKQTRAQREALKTRSDYMKEAQHAFNRYVRLRDTGRPCICCGRPLEFVSIGGGFDAGHYRSVGSAPHLRFNPDNCHGQAKQCNRYGAGRAVDYRIGLINRIGIARVEALEADTSSPKWSADDLKAIRDDYRAKAKQLEKQL